MPDRQGPSGEAPGGEQPGGQVPGGQASGDPLPASDIAAFLGDSPDSILSIPQLRGGRGELRLPAATAPFWRERLRGTNLRRLRERLLDRWSCADTLSANQRRALLLRAGLFGRQPASWSAIARRLGVSPERAVRLGLSGVTGLTSGGACGTGGAELGTSLPAGASPSAPGNGADGDGSDPKDMGDVLGMTDRPRGSLGDTGTDQGLNLGGAGEGGSGIPNALFALLVTLLALALAVAVAVYRRGALPLLPPVPQVGRSGKPLLFLDVDGVIALSAFSGPLPPGRWHGPAEESVFVAEQSGELVRTLATRYELVWASGWGKAANWFSDVLELDEKPHALTFGRSARNGPSDWKIRWVDRAAGTRPLAWVDDNIGHEHFDWAAERDAPTFLVRTTPNTGITYDDVRALLDWADSLGSGDSGRFARRRGDRVAARG